MFDCSSFPFSSRTVALTRTGIALRETGLHVRASCCLSDMQFRKYGKIPDVWSEMVPKHGKILKKIGSKAWERFAKYKHATTIAEAMGNSANWQDLSGDFEKGYNFHAGDETMTSSTNVRRRKAHPTEKLMLAQNSSLRNWSPKFLCLRLWIPSTRLK